MEIRLYHSEDRAALLDAFDSNTPEWFHPLERAAFESFLADPPERYLVAEHDGRVVASGGHADARICWLLVHRSLHGNGIGRLMMMHLLREIGSRTVTLATVPDVVEFYRKLGFRELSREADGFAPGFDRVEMVKKMEVCG
jgi:ribosomal protein S18 acetylase RimI-like enzyme